MMSALVRPIGVSASVLLATALLATARGTDAEPVSFLREAGPCRAGAGAGIGDEAVSARFRRTDSDTIVVAHGEDAVVAGTVTTAGGTPLAGATVCVEEQLIGAAAEAGGRVVVPRTGFARTDGAGNYVYRLPPGPNREAVVVYRDSLGEATAAVRYFASAAPTLRIAPLRARNRGRPVRFWGKLPGPQSQGRVVVLQAARGNVQQVARGRDEWMTFRQATTNRAGRFEAWYQFNRTPYDYTYTFRALVPRQAGYPWLTGTSPSVAVRVNVED
jgi:hypothetical protein